MLMEFYSVGNNCPKTARQIAIRAKQVDGGGSETKLIPIQLDMEMTYKSHI